MPLKKIFRKARKTVKKLIPKEIRPFAPYIAAGFLPPGAVGLGSLNPAMQKAIIAAGTRFATDDEADLKDLGITAALAAAPDIAGEFSALPEGQAEPNIGIIPIGTTYVQEMLNRMTKELNEAIFDIFISVKDVQEGTYAYVAGGLSDEVDHEAQKAINASNKIVSKTEELRGEEQ